LSAPELRSLTTEEWSLLSAIGQQIGVAVENARLYDQAGQAAAISERHRLARELHDSVTQSLYSVTLYAEAAARAWPTMTGRRRLNTCKSCAIPLKKRCARCAY
jgi:signal transduction histidine kinase